MSLFQKLTRRQVNKSPTASIQDENGSTSLGPDNDLKLTRHYGLVSLIFLCVSNSIGSGKHLVKT